MSQSHTDPKHEKARIFLIALSLVALLIPGNAFPAERDGAVLFFSFEDLQKELSQPTPPQWLLSFTWQSQTEQQNDTTPLERNYFWGNGLGIDGYTRPGTRPLWGY